jgi:hypothetical protein
MQTLAWNLKVVIDFLTDAAGKATLAGIELTEDTLSFTKQYDGREDTIHYRFRKQADGTWKGGYSGTATSEGEARCIVTQVPDDFLINQ